MKNINFFIYVFAVVFSSCSNFKKSTDKTEIPTDSISQNHADNTVNDTAQQIESSPKNKPAEIVNRIAEAQYKPSSNSGYKIAFNERFNFSFELPDNWKALDKSNNGDGYYIVNDEDNVDIRIYGEDISGNPLAYDLTTQACEKNIKFKYEDKVIGSKCISSDDITYLYPASKLFISFYIKADDAWMKTHADIIEHMAKNIHLIQLPT